MKTEKDKKYTIILIMLELIIGSFCIAISIIIWPMTVLLLVVGIVLFIAGIIEVIKLLQLNHTRKTK